MAGNTFGSVFRVTTWGESHGEAIGAVIDGCPAGIEIDPSFLQRHMERRRPGRGGAASPRSETDTIEILSGLFTRPGELLPRTTGTPISLLVRNRDAHSRSYDHLADVYRPGHGDVSYERKYGIRDHRGGGRASARETAARVAAGAVADLVLRRHGIEVIAYTVALGGIRASSRDFSCIDSNPFLCPDAAAAAEMAARVAAVKSQGDTIGGIVEIVATCPAGLGEPVFDKLDAELARALMSIGAVKGVEIGAGFAAADLLGSENNDPLTPAGFAGNNSGGILAGISNGDQLVLRVAVKPIPSIGQEQQTINRAGEPVTITIGGRHDISAIPRIVPVCEAMVRLVLVDHLLRQKIIGC